MEQQQEGSYRKERQHPKMTFSSYICDGIFVSGQLTPSDTCEKLAVPPWPTLQTHLMSIGLKNDNRARKGIASHKPRKTPSKFPSTPKKQGTTIFEIIAPQKTKSSMLPYPKIRNTICKYTKHGYNTTLLRYIFQSFVLILFFLVCWIVRRFSRPHNHNHIFSYKRTAALQTRFDVTPLLQKSCLLILIIVFSPLHSQWMCVNGN